MAPKKTNETVEQEAPAQTVDMEAIQAAVAEAVQAEKEKILAEAKAEAAKILEDAKAQVAKSEDEKAAERAAELARGEELVTVRLFKDAKNYKDDVFVQVNGENCLIKRGETVQIKRKFAEALANSDRQDLAAADLMTELSEQYEEASRKHNM